MDREPETRTPLPQVMNWRERLRLAVEQDGRKQAAIARQAGIASETLTRILTGSQPHFETVARIAHACGVTVGWLLDEKGYAVSEEQRRKLVAMAAIILQVTKEPRG